MNDTFMLLRASAKRICKFKRCEVREPYGPPNFQLLIMINVCTAEVRNINNRKLKGAGNNFLKI